jgi:peptide deformylase
MKINYYGDSILTTPTKKIEVFDDNLKKIIEDMYETMEDEGGCGLAANQVGLNKSMFVSDLGVFINPEILEQEGTQTIKNGEGCLSFPLFRIKVDRAKKIRMKFIDEDFKEKEETFEDFSAIICLHEYDHLLGKTFLDYVGPVKRDMLIRKMKKWRKRKGL